MVERQRHREKGDPLIYQYLCLLGRTRSWSPLYEAVRPWGQPLPPWACPGPKGLG